MTISPLERASAALQETVHSQWRDWVRYLEAHLTLLDARAAERQISFERNTALEEQATAAQANLAALPIERRQLFDAIREERRQTVQLALETEAGNGRRLDPDTVERQSLQALLNEALGSQESAGWGSVPFRDGDGIIWYEVNTARLSTLPTAASYSLNSRDRNELRTRYMLAGLLIVGGVLFFLVWFLWPRNINGGNTEGQPIAFANEQPLDPWPVMQVIVERSPGDPATLPVIARAMTHWSSSSNDPVAAFWDEQHLVPLRLCIPAELLATTAALTLTSSAELPDRHYRFVATEATTDLLVFPCSGNAPARAARLQQIPVPDDARPGTSQTLSDGKEVLLDQLSLIGPGDDPTLPSGQARLTVSAQADISDWTAYGPRLLLSDGQFLLPAEPPRAGGEHTLLSYLVPLPTTTTVVVWSLSAPGSEHAARWRATLPPPPDRATIVQAALAVSKIVASFDGRSTATITLTIRNQRDHPFVLTTDDLRLLAGANTEPLPLTVTPVDGLQPALAPGATRTLTLTAPLQGNSHELVLIVGANRFRLWSDQ
jgi:hypothetical protein